MYVHCQGMLFGNGQPIGLLFPREEHHSDSQLSEVAYRFLDRIETQCTFFPSTLASHLAAHIWKNNVGETCGCSFCHS